VLRSLPSTYETSGTGELAGIHGEGQIIIGPGGEHSYTLDYEL
jgi:hypothetical protein